MKNVRFEGQVITDLRQTRSANDDRKVMHFGDKFPSIEFDDLYLQNLAIPSLIKKNSRQLVSKQSFMSIVGAYKRTSHLGFNDNYLEPTSLPTLERRHSQMS